MDPMKGEFKPNLLPKEGENNPIYRKRYNGLANPYLTLSFFACAVIFAAALTLYCTGRFQKWLKPHQWQQLKNYETLFLAGSISLTAFFGGFFLLSAKHALSVKLDQRHPTMGPARGPDLVSRPVQEVLNEDLEKNTVGGVDLDIAAKKEAMLKQRWAFLPGQDRDFRLQAFLSGSNDQAEHIIVGGPVMEQANQRNFNVTLFYLDEFLDRSRSDELLQKLRGVFLFSCKVFDPPDVILIGLKGDAELITQLEERIGEEVKKYSQNEPQVIVVPPNPKDRLTLLDRACIQDVEKSMWILMPLSEPGHFEHIPYQWKEETTINWLVDGIRDRLFKSTTVENGGPRIELELVEQEVFSDDDDVLD